MTTTESPIMERKYEFIQKHVFNYEISHMNMIKRCFDNIYPSSPCHNIEKLTVTFTLHTKLIGHAVLVHFYIWGIHR